MKLIHWLLHMIDCPDEDLERTDKKKMVRCKKCGREYFIFSSY